jgi:ABC-type transport system involved in multi-copper enzyme maturation permease subunit
MKGLLRKIFLEIRWPVLFFSLGLTAIMSILTWVLPTILGDIDKFFDAVPLFKPLIAALLGVNPDSQFSAEMTQAFLWVHPTVLATIWGHEVMYCTRIPAGEIDRGTVDFLLGLPVSRWKLYLTETFGWLASGLIIICAGIFGHTCVAQKFASEMQPTPSATLMILCNLFSMYIAVGSIAFLVSSMSDHRNRATGIVFAILLVSFLLNFLAQFWQPAKPWAKLSVLEYYRPATVIQSGDFPAMNVGILLGIGIVCWTAAGITLSRRSICTV